jgi:serine phosphatase RsbU (regulator of sigma subunit)
MAEERHKHERDRMAELQRAREIQANLPPTSLPHVAGLTVVADYRPAAHVAGDLYDVFELPNGRTAMAILDVVGHGVIAALLTSVVKMSLRYHLEETSDTGMALAFVHQDLLGCTSEAQFVTTCVGLWDRTERTWTYSAAGHPGGVLLAKGEIHYLSSTGGLLGVFPESRWRSETIRLRSGDRLFLYTDGVTEAGAPARSLGTLGLGDALRKSSHLSCADQISLVLDQAETLWSSEPADDMTMVALEVPAEHER